MLKVTELAPRSDAVSRGEGRSAFVGGDGPFDVRDGDEIDSWANFIPLTRQEAASLRLREPGVSPWRVVGAQVVAGALIASAAGAASGDRHVAWSALYGAATVFIPGALMARGMTSQLSGASVLGSVAAVFSWSVMKMMVSVVMLVMAPTVVVQLSWPALLVALVLCLQTYWFALLWRGRSKNSTDLIEA